MEQQFIQINQLIRDTIQWYKKHFQTLVLIAIVVSAPFLAIDLGFFFHLVTADQYNHWSIFVSVVSVVLSVWGAGAYYYYLQQRAMPPSFSALWKKGWTLWPSMVLTSVIMAAIILAGLILLIVPGIVAIVWFIFSQAIVVTEGKTGWQAIKQSVTYVKGRFWEVFGRLVLIGIISLIIGSIGLYSTLLGNVLELLFGPFVVIYIYMMYESLRTVRPKTPEPAKTA